MAYFTEISKAIVVALMQFPTITTNTAQLFSCKSGERAGFIIKDLPQSDGTVFRVSQVYDYTSGAGILLGTVSVVPGLDLTGGMFSSGCFCSGDPMSAGVTFYQVDYV